MMKNGVQGGKGCVKSSPLCMKGKTYMLPRPVGEKTRRLTFVV